MHISKQNQDSLFFLPMEVFLQAQACRQVARCLLTDRAVRVT